MRSNLFQEKYLSLNEKDLAAKRIYESNYNLLFISKSYENKNELLIQPRGGVEPAENINHLLEIWQKQGLM